MTKMGKRNEWEEESTERERREGNVGGEREGGRAEGSERSKKIHGAEEKIILICDLWYMAKRDFSLFMCILECV